MEPRAGAAQALSAEQEVEDRRRWRSRLLATCVLLIGLAIVQSPGLLVADTKIDLALAPTEFLQRALSAWDAEGAFGQLQNQAYGYLWPMGPFFVLGDSLGLSAWLVQRLWLALVLCVAFTGAATLVRELGVRSQAAALIAGIAYAVSPRMLTVLGPISIEAWPSAMAPWVLLPLVIGARRGSPWRAAALSALAIAMVGGVNAAATAAVLPLGVVWLLSRRRGPRWTPLIVGWPLFTALGTLWWLVPLFVLGRYSPPFLDFIESASNTTFPTTFFDALRGTSNWVPYVDPASRAGFDLITTPYLVLNAGVLLTAGLIGLTLIRTRERVFLTVSLALGLLMVTFGHIGATSGWFSLEAQQLLDGVLAPLRNVHKFDPVIRLPLVIGLAWAVEEILERRRAATDRPDRANSTTLVGVVVLALMASATPVAMGRVTPAGGFTGVPGYWASAAQWLGERSTEGTTLLLPGSSFADYTWGRAQDEPLQVLARTPWAVRNAIPLTPAGTIRMLDGLEASMLRGEGGDGMLSALRRAGVSHLVVRNDLQRRPDIVDPVLVHQALRDTPGILRVAAFGPEIGGEPVLEDDGRRVLINEGWQDTYPAIEIFEVVGRQGGAVHGTPVGVVGGPEDLSDLADLGLLADEPTVLAADGSGSPAQAEEWILTDGYRAVERHFGALHDSTSETLTRDQPMRLRATERDYLLGDGGRWSTWAEYDGIADVRASSSESDPSAGGQSQSGRLPFAAIDGDPSTQWVSRLGSDDPAWWEVRLDGDRAVSSVRLTAGEERQELRVRLDGWTSERVVLDAGETRSIDTGGRRTDVLRILDDSGRRDVPMSLAEVEVPGVVAQRVLRLPALDEGWSSPEAIVLRPADPGRSGCAEVDGDVRCREGEVVDGEEQHAFRRIVTLPSSQHRVLQVWARPRAGTVLDELVLGGGLFGVEASTTSNPDPRAGAVAAVDGDPGTTWTASATDAAPSLALRWLGQRRVDTITVGLARSAPASRPTRVRLLWPGGRRVVELDDRGRGEFPAIRTDRLRVVVSQSERATSLDFVSRPSTVPVGIGELRLGGLDFLPAPVSETATALPCGSGPSVRIGAQIRETAITASAQEIYAGGPLRARVCGGPSVDLASGENDIAVAGSEAFDPAAVVLGYRSASPVSVLSGDDEWSAPAAGVLATHHNANEGWTAQGGETAVVDGWRQAVVTAGPGPTRLDYAPDSTYRLGLLAGGIAMFGLLAALLLLVRARRHLDAPALMGREVSPLAASGGLVVVAGLVVGWPGAVTAAVAAVAALVMFERRRGELILWAVVGLGAIGAATAYAVRPWAAFDGWAGVLVWPQLLALGAWAVASAAALRRVEVDPQRRMAGSSTQR